MAAPRLAASDDDPGVAQNPFGIAGMAFDQRRAARDRLQHVVEIMRDAAGDLTERMHPFSVGGALLGRLARRHFLAHPLLQPGVDLLLEVQQALFGVDIQEDAQRLLDLPVLPAQRNAADAKPFFAAIRVPEQEFDPGQGGFAPLKRPPDRKVLIRQALPIRVVRDPFAPRRPP